MSIVRTVIERLQARPESVRGLLSRPKGAHDSFELVTFGGGGHLPTEPLGKAGTLLESDDIEKYGPR